ncbi:MAG: fumarylacetoacetate hydrolase family protein, partial [Fimbriimonadales bacterium]
PAILGIGLNYRRHAEETGGKVPDWPVVFLKNPASVQNPGDPIVIPRTLTTEEVDYECELAVVIGRDARNVPAAQALECVLGYTAANDVSARDWQMRRSGRQWCRAKSFDTFCPLGPCLVTRDEIPDPGSLRLGTRLNGETVQDWTTSDLIFDVPRLIEFLSADTTLLAGTVILTGTPHGVGMARQPPLWLKPGDVVTVWVDGVGELTNPVV